MGEHVIFMGFELGDFLVHRFLFPGQFPRELTKLLLLMVERPGGMTAARSVDFI